MSKRIVIAVDATERSLDALALGRLLADASGASVALVSVFPYHPLDDPTGSELSRVREEGRGILLELGESAGLEPVDAQVIASNLVGRELQRVTEQDTTGVVVLGSTGRGAVGRILPGAMAERLLAGAAAPLAIATRGYAESSAGELERIGVAFDGSDESRHALEAGRVLARSSGAVLRVISVFERVAFGAIAAGRTGGASVNELLRAELRSPLDDALTQPPQEDAIEGRFLEGSPSAVLAAESADLDLLVTGSRGYGPRAAVLLGSTTHALMRTATCPGLVPAAWGEPRPRRVAGTGDLEVDGIANTLVRNALPPLPSGDAGGRVGSPRLRYLRKALEDVRLGRRSRVAVVGRTTTCDGQRREEHRDSNEGREATTDTYCQTAYRRIAATDPPPGTSSLRAATTRPPERRTRRAISSTTP